jgi:malonyl-ACP decarboxylase
VKRVIVSGMGIHSAAGAGCALFARALRAGESLVRPYHVPQLTFPLLKAAVADFDFVRCLRALQQRKPELREATVESAIRVARRCPRSVQLSVLVAIEAWHEAELGYRALSDTRVGIVIAGHNTTQGYQHEIRAALAASTQLGFIAPAYAFQFLDTDHLGTLSQVLGVRGEGHTIGGASASGNGYIDACVVVGCMADLSPFELQALHNLGALAPQRESGTSGATGAPFDRDHEGFTLGEASACVILESAESAAARGVSPLVEVLSAVSSLSGTRLPSPDARAEAQIMVRALREARRAPGGVDYVSTHGTGSPAGDQAEVAALREVFGDLTQSPYLNSTKAVVGHCLWSAGVVEAIATIIQMNGSFVHGTPGLTRPIDESLRWQKQAQTDARLRIALSNGFGFGGIHSCLTFGHLVDG